jgi:two-component sensor histidine kinase
LDFGSYVKALCANLVDIQAAPDTIVLRGDGELVILDLDMVTALGIVVTELVSNSYDHAFPNGKGSITVSVRRSTGNAETATLIISDNGTGFKAQAESKRHGLGLVRRLVEQVGGTVTTKSDFGTVWIVDFPIEHQVSTPAASD